MANISTISKICFMYLHKISRIRNYLSEDACKAIILSVVISRLDYGNALLYGVNQNCIDKLQKIQNIAARLVTRSRKRDHVTPILRSLHWLPVKFRSEYKLLLYVFKCMEGSAPAYLRELVTMYNPGRALRSQSQLLFLSVPRVRTSTYGARTFSSSAAILWNNLPISIRLCDSLYVFKRKIKTVLFTRAFELE